MRNKTYNNPFNPAQPLLSEGLQYKDMDGMVKPTIHVDEFSSKMGDDADIIVLSFYVRDAQAAKDLMAWFEKGYDFVLDADKSPGEIKPNRYLVYVEMRRRSAAPLHIETMLQDLSTLTEFEPNQWQVNYQGRDFDWSTEEFAKNIPLTPDKYKQENEQDLNVMRTAAGIEPKKIHEPGQDVKALQSAAGIR